MAKLKTCGLILATLALLCAGCGSGVNDNDAIRSAINTHVAGRGNLNASAFDTDVQKIDVQGEQATADVVFRVKGGPGMMQLTYNLKKTGGAWAVVESNPIGSNFTHPALDPNAPTSATPGVPAPDVMDALRQKMATPAK